jgi:SAM-dependent methyltransferase
MFIFYGNAIRPILYWLLLARVGQKSAAFISFSITQSVQEKSLLMTSEQSKILPGQEHVPCDLCHADDPEPLYLCRDEIYGFSGQFTFVRCRQCGMVYQTPRPTFSKMAGFYPDMDYHAFKAKSGFTGWLKSILQNRSASHIKRLLNTEAQNAHVLEVGCGAGDLLLPLHNLGLTVTGLEPNAAAAENGRQRGLDIHTGHLGNVVLPQGHYDIAILKYVLEHVPSPRAALSTLHGLLKPGGKLLLWLPNNASWDAALFKARWRGLDAPRHLYVFTPAHIQRYLNECGFIDAKISMDSAPNDWAGSFSYVAGWHTFGAQNPVALAAWTPVSLLSALANRAGRMVVLARRG